jgi:mRNA-degrading endonuclease RelE of RelBE toxin-antitoxin system
MTIFSTPRFDRTFKKLSAAEQKDVRATIAKLPQAFGDPHQHAGLGIRKLIKSKYECRVGLKLRILFDVSKTEIIMMLVGDHDDIRDWLKNN